MVSTGFLEPIPHEYRGITVNKADEQLQTDALKKIKQSDVREREMQGPLQIGGEHLAPECRGLSTVTSGEEHSR